MQDPYSEWRIADNFVDTGEKFGFESSRNLSDTEKNEFSLLISNPELFFPESTEGQVLSKLSESAAFLNEVQKIAIAFNEVSTKKERDLFENMLPQFYGGSRSERFGTGNISKVNFQLMAEEWNSKINDSIKKN